MRTVAMDIETDDLNAKRIWVICAQDVDTGETYEWREPDRYNKENFIGFCRGVDQFVLHNGIGFDIPVINRLIEPNLIRTDQVIDTLIVSRLVDYTLDGKGHSLRAWGKRLGEFKIDFGSDFSELTEEMVTYCHQDVEVTVRLYKNFKDVIYDPEWQVSLRVEHDIQAICEEMTDNGFFFNEESAKEMLGEIVTRKEQLEADLQEDFPPVLTEVNRILYRTKKDTGEPYANVVRCREKYFQTKVDWFANPPELVCYDYVEFNPSSPKQRIERLWDAGWQPYEKTKGHMTYEREQSRRQR